MANLSKNLELEKVKEEIKLRTSADANPSLARREEALNEEKVRHARESFFLVRGQV